MTMGPAPMMRMLWRSVRLGILCSGSLSAGAFHQRDELVEQVADVAGPRAGFRMPLETERRPVRPGKALDRTVEEGAVRDLQVGRQAVRGHREAVVLAGDHHPAVALVAHRMVRPVVAELHLLRAGAAGEGEYLVAEADAEDRDGPFDETRGRLDRVVAGLRVPRSVRQEDAVGGVRQGFLEARPGGHHDDLA